MITHIVVFEFRPEASAEIQENFHRDLAELKKQLGSLLIEYRHGPALHLRPSSGDYGIAASVQDKAALDLYLDDPRHQSITERYQRTLFAKRTAVQITSDKHNQEGSE